MTFSVLSPKATNNIADGEMSESECNHLSDQTINRSLKVSNNLRGDLFDAFSVGRLGYKISMVALVSLAYHRLYCWSPLATKNGNLARWVYNSMKTKHFIFLVFSLSCAACQPNTQPPNNRNAPLNSVSNNANLTNKSTVSESNSNKSAKPSPSIAPDKSKIKTFDGTGAITKINLEIGSVELDHEEIKGLMPKMIMEFYVSDKKMLDGLKVGDKVDFVLEDNAGAEQIIRIKRK